MTPAALSSSFGPARLSARCAEEACEAELPRPILFSPRNLRPLLLEIGKQVMHSDLTGYLEETDSTSAEVVRHPVTSEPALLSRSGASWALPPEDGGRPEIPPGAAVLLRDGNRLRIDGSTFGVPFT